MKYKVGQMVAYQLAYKWMKGKVDFGVITEVSKGASYPYKIDFPENDETDWFNENSVEDMVQTLEYLLEAQSRTTNNI